MNLHSDKNLPGDFTIGDREDAYSGQRTPERKCSHSLEDDDFLLGESGDEEATQTAIVSPELELETNTARVVSSPIPRAKRSDFQSINELITEELDEQPSKTTAHSENIELEAKLPSVIEGNPLQTVGDPIEEKFQEIEHVNKVLRQSKSEIDPLMHLQKLPNVVKPIFDTINQNRKNLKEQQNYLQQMISRHVHQGNFDQVSSLDQLKKKIDEMLLKIRALENRFNRALTQVVNENVDSHESLINPINPAYKSLKKNPVRNLPKFGAKDQKEVKTKVKPKVKARKRKAYNPGGSRRPQWLKALTLLFIFSLTVPAYHLSATWGVKKSIPIEPSNYESFIPLVRASATDKSFNGIVEDSWKQLPEEERKKAVRQLGAMVRVDGYETIFLLYKTQGIAAIYNIPKDKLGLM